MSEFKLVAKTVSVHLANRCILDRVSFEADAGKVTAIVGPNGSGKTTLLRVVTKEIEYSGTVHINGHSIEKMSSIELAQTRAVLPQSGSIAFPFTLLELVRLGLTSGLASNDTGLQQRLPLQAIKRVGLAGYEARLVQELSGGERQRAQLARVLVQVWEPVLAGQPRWLILDEPVSALDIAHQLKVMHIARDYARAGGGVIAVMHDLNLTALFADKVSLLSEGRVRRDGSPSIVLNDTDLSACYGCEIRTNQLPHTGGPWVLPHACQSLI